MSSDRNNNSISQKLTIKNEIDQIDKISKINKLNLQTKINLKFLKNNYNKFIKFLNLKDGRFILYSEKEILLFNKNLKYKILFPFKNDNKDHDIKFVKCINKVNILFADNKSLYISTIKSSTILPSTIKKVRNVLDAIELKNGMLLVVADEDLLKIKVNKNNFEVNRLCENPHKNHKLFLRDSYHYIETFKLSIYELPKNNILISLIIVSSELAGGGMYSLKI